MPRLYARTLFIAFTLLFSAPASASDSVENVILVLDASGSMWRRVDGKSKIEIARNSVAGLVSEWKPGIRLGLIAYGHRRRGDCGDIEMVLPVGKVDAARFTGVVNGISPKGKTPLSAAVRMASEELKYTEEPATVILMSDGLETCHMDPCVLAQELEAAGVDFTVHVIGLDLKKGEQAKLRCLADNTGGLFLSARDATSLNQAFKKVEQEVIQAKPKKPEPKIDPGLRLEALMVEDGKPLSAGVHWVVTETEADINGNYKTIVEGWDTPFFKLETGKYRVAVKWGSVLVESEVDVDRTKLQKYQVILGAGQVKLSAAMTAESTPVTAGVLFRVSEPKPDINGNYKTVVEGWDNPLFSLPAGSYRVRVIWGSTTTDDTFEVSAGQVARKHVIVNAGRVKLSAAMTTGGAPVTGGVLFRVSEPEPDINGNYKTVVEGWDDPLLTLAAGTYRVHVTRGTAAAVDSIDVKAGRVDKKQLNLNAGQVKLSAAVQAGGAPITGGVLFSVTEAEPDINGNYGEVASGWDNPLVTLSAGTYRVLVTVNNQKYESMLQIKAGEVKKHQIVLQ